jgi:hypothetical protein
MIPLLQVVIGPESCNHLCCDSEGWGPLNHSRNSLTPCFLNLLILLVSALGLVTGGPTLWRLAKRRGNEPSQKDWQFWATLVSVCRMDIDQRIHFAFSLTDKLIGHDSCDNFRLNPTSRRLDTKTSLWLEK